MSSIEKALNKNDLIAYKNYDSNQYSLVPGLQHAKHGSPGKYSGKASGLGKADSPKAKQLLDQAHFKLDFKQDQLRQMGYNDMGLMLNSAERNKLPLNPANRISRLGAGGLPDKGLHMDDSYTRRQHFDQIPLGIGGINISEHERRLLAASQRRSINTQLYPSTFSKRGTSFQDPILGQKVDSLSTNNQDSLQQL